MVFLAQFVFLFLPDKVQTLKLTIISFYLIAAGLKLNFEWLSGAAIPPDWIRPGSLAEFIYRKNLLSWACYYVLLLEGVLVFGLFSRRHWIRWLVLSQLFLFHFVSEGIVGWFYPSIMYGLLSIFVLVPEAIQRRALPANAVFLLILWGLQIIPRMTPGDSSVNGIGRIFALNMFDGLVDCHSKILVEFKDRTLAETIDTKLYFQGVRYQCDPYIHFSIGKKKCAALQKSDPFFLRIRWSLASKLRSEAEFKELVSLENICDPSLSYSAVTGAAWIGDTVPEKAGSHSQVMVSRLPLLTFSKQSSKANSDLGSGNEFNQYRESAARTGLAAERLDASGLKSLRLVLRHSALNSSDYSASKASPLVNQQGVFIGTDTSHFYHLDHLGNIRWMFQSLNSGPGFHATAASDRDSIYVGNYEGELIAFNKTTGQVRWLTLAGDSIGSSVALVEQDGHKNILVAVELNKPKEGYLANFDAETGSLLWRSEPFGDQAHGSPAVDLKLGLVFIGANNHRLYAFDLRTGARKWMHQTRGAFKSSPAVGTSDRTSMVFIANRFGEMLAFESAAGSLRWNRQVGSTQSSFTVVEDENLIVISTHRTGILGVSMKTGEIRWRYQNSENLFDTGIRPSGLLVMSPVNGEKSHTLIGCDGAALCVFENRSGALIAKYLLPGRLSGVPVLYQGSIWLALDRGGLIELSQTKGGKN